MISTSTSLMSDREAAFRSPDLQHDLPAGSLGLALVMRCARLVKRVDAVDDWFQLTLIRQACQVLQIFTACLREECQSTLTLTHQAQEWQEDHPLDQDIHIGKRRHVRPRRRENPLAARKRASGHGIEN